MRNRLIIVFFSLCFAFTANGQKQINTPYSRFNIGTLQPEGSFRSLGMGRTGVAMRDNSSIYFTNPASYSSFDTISFMFDFGLDYGRNFLTSSTTKYSSDDLNFHHFVMGFPIAKGFGFAVGIVPTTSGFYQVKQTVTKADAVYDTLVGGYGAAHSGTGGISKIFTGVGLKVTKNLSIGVNMILLTGQLNRTNEFLLEDPYNVFHSSSKESLHINGINFDYGLQYTATIQKKYFLNIGASVTPGHDFNSNFEQLSQKYTLYGSVDTIVSISDKSPTFIPRTIRMGISFGKKNKFTTGFDYIATKWSDSKIPGSVGYAADSKEYRFGMEYIPEKFSNYSFVRRMEYRVGAHMGDNYLKINNEQLKEYGVSIGIGIPMRRTYSKTNLYFDYSKLKGSAANNLHNENYITCGLSINLYDSWFRKREYE